MYSFQSALRRVGWLSGFLLPVPSCPYLLLPMAYTSPFSSSMRVQNIPQLTSTNLDFHGINVGTDSLSLLGLPNSPQSFDPHMYRSPETVRNEECMAPAEICLVRTISKYTLIGLNLVLNSPTPNAPYSPYPQAYTSPFSSRHRVWDSPQCIFVAGRGRFTLTGTLLHLTDLSSMPSFPSALQPCVNTSPSCVINAMCFSPQDMVFMAWSRVTCLGRLWTRALAWGRPSCPWLSLPHTQSCVGVLVYLLGIIITTIIQQSNALVYHKSRFLAHSQVVPREFVVGLEVHHAVDGDQERDGEEEAHQDARQAGRLDCGQDVAPVLVVPEQHRLFLEQSLVGWVTAMGTVREGKDVVRVGARRNYVAHVLQNLRVAHELAQSQLDVGLRCGQLAEVAQDVGGCICDKSTLEAVDGLPINKGGEYLGDGYFPKQLFDGGLRCTHIGLDLEVVGRLVLAQSRRVYQIQIGRTRCEVGGAGQTTHVLGELGEDDEGGVLLGDGHCQGYGEDGSHKYDRFHNVINELIRYD